MADALMFVYLVSAMNVLLYSQFSIESFGDSMQYLYCNYFLFKVCSVISQKVVHTLWDIYVRSRANAFTSLSLPDSRRNFQQ